jgi:hypothetical protein
MNIWRPFANDLVTHTFEGFRKKYDKIYSLKPSQPIPSREKIDIKSLFPYNLPSGDLEKRLEDFTELQKKVDKQRDDIKKRDVYFKNKHKEKIVMEKLEAEKVKNAKKSMMMRIRSLGIRKTARNREHSVEEIADTHTFHLTNLGGNEKSKANTTLPVLNPSRANF